MIRVLHCVSNMDRAGIETMLMNYYRNMDRSAVQFDFLCNKKKPGSYDGEILRLGGRIYHTPGLNPMKFISYQRCMDALFREHPEYRIIHAHNGAFGVYALYAARRNRIPCRIFHAHGASLAMDLKWPLKLFCKARLKRNCTHFWSCGRDAAVYYFGKEAWDRGECRVIRNAIDTERFRFDPQTRAELRERYGLSDAFVVGHIGRFAAQKNHGFLLEVFARLRALIPEAALVLLGDGEGMDRIRKQAAALGLGESVLFMGNVGNSHEWYQAFDVFLLPSIWEGLPVVGIEAQAAGLRCLFSDRVTEEAAVTENAEFLSLDLGPELWARRAAAAAGRSRRDLADAVREAGYDIRGEAKKLEAYYQNLYVWSEHENRNSNASVY